MKARKGCWTCTARKLRCDGGLPACRNCARAQRECQGYSPRLSWPKIDDRKRAVIGHDVPPGELVRSGRTSAGRFFVNTTWQDVESFLQLSRCLQPSLLISCSTDPWAGLPLHVDHWDLIYYFHDTAYLSLVTFSDSTAPELRDLLIRMALAQETAPGLALYHALLGFSSLCHSGLNKQALQLKISAIRHLSDSMNSGPLTAAQAIQHMGASMLLAAFEMLLASESSGEWLWHVWGAMDTLQASGLQHWSYHDDNSYLLDWVYFHDTISRFTVRHWRHPSLLAPEIPTAKRRSKPRRPMYPPLLRHRPTTPSPNPAHVVLNLLSETCATLLDPRDPASRHPAYQTRLAALEAQVEQAPPSSPDETTGRGAELYRLATRVYLARASRASLPEGPRDDSSSAFLLHDAFAETTALLSCADGACIHFFPLFILAGEARSEEQRVAVLSLLDRTEERNGRVRSIGWFREAVCAVWVQCDLHADGELLVDYPAIMGAVISSSCTIPSFA